MITSNRNFVFLRNIKRIIDLIECCIYDLARYLRYSSICDCVGNFGKLEAKIMAHCHVLEKGLTLSQPRPGFGKQVALSLVNLLMLYGDKRHPLENSQYSLAISVLKSYIDFHEQIDFDVSDIKLKMKNIIIVKELAKAGAVTVFRRDILLAAQANFKNFSQKRYSIRNYEKKSVDLECIKEAVRIAQKSPSVCNRQSARVYIISNAEIIKKILTLQNGNRGFGHMADKLLIITSDLQSFESAAERYQPFIDGGIFTMALLYALHYQGLGACALNWSVLYQRDKILKKITKIKNSENIITIIAVGHIPEVFKVAASNRKKIDEIIKII